MDDNGPQGGFTLLEILIALLITSLIMTATYAVLFTTLDARDRIEKGNLEEKIGPAILDLIGKDIGGAWCWNIHHNDVFKGESHYINGERADRLHFITTTDSSFTEENEDQQVRSDLSEVSYLCRQNPRNPDLLELWRRQDFHVDDNITEGGLYELVYSRVYSFQVTYYADLYEDAEKIDEWDASRKGRLPAAMVVDLVMEIDPTLAGYALDEMNRKRLTYHRVIFFPQGSELTMAVRPVIPTSPETAAGDGGTSGSGSGSGNNPNGSSGRFGGGDESGGPGRGKGGLGGGKGSGHGSENPPPFNPPSGGNNGPPGGNDINLDELLRLLNGKGGGGRGGGGFGK